MYDNSTCTHPEYGLLLGCLQLDQFSTCLIHCYERVEIDEVPILNDRDCPLLFQLKLITAIPTTAVMGAVSIVHQCSQKCQFQQERAITRVEREVSMDLLVFKHDYDYTEYCLNIKFYYVGTP